MSHGMSGASVLVTGSSGFIGSHLCAHLVENRGCKVLGIDNLLPQFDKPGTGLPTQNKDLFSFRQVDISDNENVKKIFKENNADFIFHLAAVANPRACKTRFDLAFKVNVVGTKNIVEDSPRESKLIFMSSAAVYGKPNMIPIPESHTRNGGDPYAVTKILGEDLCDCFRKNYGHNICIGRNFNAFGEGQVSDYVIPSLIRQAILGNSIEVWNSSPVRDFLYIEDTINALITIAERGRSGEKYNIGSGRGTSIGELTVLVKQIMGHDIHVRDLKKQVMGSSQLIADPSRLKTLGWVPRISIEDGLQRTIEWSRSCPQILAA